jgi:hypothetical protein
MQNQIAMVLGSTPKKKFRGSKGWWCQSLHSHHFLESKKKPSCHHRLWMFLFEEMSKLTLGWIYYTSVYCVHTQKV